MVDVATADGPLEFIQFRSHIKGGINDFVAINTDHIAAKDDGDFFTSERSRGAPAFMDKILGSDRAGALHGLPQPTQKPQPGKTRWASPRSTI